MTWAKRTAIALAVLLALFFGAALWLLRSESGARFVLARAEAALNGALSVQAIHGPLTGPLKLEGVSYIDADAGIDVRAGMVQLDVATAALLRKRLHVRHLNLEDVDVFLTSTDAVEKEPGKPFSLQPPLDIVVDALSLRDAHIAKDGATLLDVDELALAGGWTKAAIAVRELVLASPQGTLNVTEPLLLHGDYRSQGAVSFRWMAADEEIVGHLQAGGTDGVTTLQVVLDKPLLANIDATLGHDKTLPWTLELDAPSFNPNDFIDTQLHSVALKLQGEGTLEHAQLHGGIDLDDHHIELQELVLHLTNEVLDITALRIASPDFSGKLSASGKVLLDEDPPVVDARLNWHDVQLPAELAGQVLESAGELELRGSSAHYAATVQLTLGPPGKLADITLALTGTTEQIALDSLHLVQAAGTLDAHGTITLQPELAWAIEARGRQFNPGVFAAEWPGALSFDLDTDGTLTDDGPQARVVLQDLAGDLRGRPISGHSDLRLTPPFIVNGTAHLASGDSHLDVRGTGSRQTDASISLAISSLGNWLPGSGGRITGDFQVQGMWPDLHITGQAAGDGLHMHETRIGQLGMDIDVRNLDAPAGHVDVTMRDLLAGGMAFDRVQAHAQGSQQQHTLQIEGSGDPLNLKLALDGSSTSADAWNGSLSELRMQVRDVEPFTLAGPTAIRWTNPSFSMDELCLRGGETQLCLAAKGTTDGAIDASYRIDSLPLALLASLAGVGEMTVIAGNIGGSGQLQRSSDGTLDGQASLSSPSGSVIWANAGNEPLVRYDNMKMQAQLGSRSTLQLVAGLDDDGRIDAQINLTATDGAQALDGNIAIRVNSLAFIELLSTEVADVKGRLQADYRISGTTAEPKLDGALQLSDFGIEIPAAGLKLKEGQASLRAEGSDNFLLDGSVKSGDGTLYLEGRGGLSASDPLQLVIKGTNVLAADIPGARAVISPDLLIKRDSTQIEVGGSVAIPVATIDLSKLPGGGVQHGSPDVVLIDAERGDDTVAGLPIRADITVKLGDEVALAGFGLDGKLAGSLSVRQSPGRAATGTGTINVTGTYQAYGQDLRIESGHLLFAGTPLNNPGLSLRAVREIKADNVTAGLQVEGTALVPELTVFSQPAMEQSEALSYLVTGKPLSQLKSGEGDMLGTAARALGTAGGDLLAKGLGSRLGVDASVSDSAALGGAAFTVGKYLSPKLYLSYGVGVFDPGEVVTLRYLISRRFNFEAENSTNGNRAGINYRYER